MRESKPEGSYYYDDDNNEKEKEKEGVGLHSSQPNCCLGSHGVK